MSTAMNLPDRFFRNRKLENLVENRTSYAMQSAEMHVYETHELAKEVVLQFPNPVLATMLEGKKIMHLDEMQAFDFLPGESLILPASEVMCIDFPEADMDNPTRCLAMAISDEKVHKTVQLLNETKPKADDIPWRFTDYNFHFTNDLAIHQIIQRLLTLFAENHPSRDLFADFMLQELIIRILQADMSKVYEEQAQRLSSHNRMAYVIQYIRENLDKQFTVLELSKQSYMSESNFHRVFKNELGITPIDFINNERLKLATSMLHNPNIKVKEVSMACGFNSLSYFIRFFKSRKQVSPKAFQMQVAG